MKHSIFSFLLLFFYAFVDLNAQDLTQNLRGKVTDKNLQTPIAEAKIVLLSDTSKWAISDLEGQFLIPKVPIGRQSILVVADGYAPLPINNILIGSGKEAFTQVQMEQVVKDLNSATITAKGFKRDKAVNDMATVSSRSFSVEETQRYAAAINDPARMATSFAGVASADDGNNLIVIRGNAPAGMLWRLEGVDIPGPNHFAAFTGSGGGVSILSAQLLANSDFYTGAFPAEYGNALSGVFDIRLRKGNAHKREYTLQAGFLGLDFAAEGPLSRSKGSFLVNYRYSTLGLLGKMGVGIGPGSFVFQDLSFNIYQPLKGGGHITVFGFGGLSSQKVNAKADSTKWENDIDRSEYTFISNTGATGVTWFQPLGKNTSIRSVLSGSVNKNEELYKKYNSGMELQTLWNNLSQTTKVSFNQTLNHNFSSKSHLRMGWMMHRMNYTQLQRFRDTSEQLLTKLDENGQAYYTQAFFQWKYKIKSNLTAYLGAHSMYLFLNNTRSFDPRASIKYDINRKNSLAFAYGHHSQLQLLPLYNAATEVNGQKEYLNRNLKMSKAHHWVLSFDHYMGKDWHFKAETYFQHLYHIPVSPDASSTFSMVNVEWDYINEKLVNNGLGKNYGLELTVEKFLSNGWYGLLTGSIYSAKYKAGDQVWRNTRYNGGHMLCFTGGKEWFFNSKKKTLGFNVKTLWYGGQRETPLDLEKSTQYEQTIRKNELAFSQKLPGYFRTDLKISYRVNHKKYTGIWSLDLQNATNRKNVGGSYWDKESKTEKFWYQTPLIPVFSYKVEF